MRLHIYSKYKELVTITGTEPAKAAQAAGFPADVRSAVYPIDFVKSAAQRDAILKTWQSTIGR